ncbi:MAG: futalosine hydrolase [Sphingobacteriales bacterium]|nr:futalosine hydrolase [Sphingobacteriales bacterium]
MKILVVAATEHELKGLKSTLMANEISSIDFLVTGVGMINTTFELTKVLLQNTYDYVINIGIAGSFDRTINLGEVVWVRKELFSEMGAEDGEEFLSLIQLGLQTHDDFPFEWGELKAPMLPEINALAQLKQVRGITVNKVHGNEASILKTNMQFSPQVESMEGAAVFYVAMKMNIPCIQIRSISNYVERRNRESWKIKEALESLTKQSVLLINEICSL